MRYPKMNEHINRAKEEIERIFKTEVDGDKMIGAIYSTSEYDKFSFFDTNRVTNISHISSLKESMCDLGLLKAPILVNKQFQIIDGQHRFAACRELGIPVEYIIGHKYGEKEIQVLNNKSKAWSPKDYLHHFKSKSLKEYVRFDRFLKNHQMSISVARNFMFNPAFNYNAFKAGNFINHEWGVSEHFAQRYNHLLECCPSWRMGSNKIATTKYFLRAFVTILRNEDVPFKEFLDRCVAYGHELKREGTKEAYLLAFETMYNKQKKQANRVAFFRRKY